MHSFQATTRNSPIRSKLPTFIKRRAPFEQIVQNHRAFLNQIVRKFGPKDSGQGHIKRFYEQVFAAIDDSLDDANIVERLVGHKDFTYLQRTESPHAGVSATRYAKHVKSGLIFVSYCRTHQSAHFAEVSCLRRPSLSTTKSTRLGTFILCRKPRE